VSPRRGGTAYVGTTLVHDFIDLCSVLLLAQRVEAGLELLLGEDAGALVELLEVLLDLGDLLRGQALELFVGDLILEHLGLLDEEVLILVPLRCDIL
jgi:hypothetical protein